MPARHPWTPPSPWTPPGTAGVHPERLDALARTRAGQGAGVPGVLFVCSHDAGRPQPAAALLNRTAKLLNRPRRMN
ncbi:hypothetical protein ABZY93_15365 [Streptomyces smyrnaeus]|uniref:hypothetical protein n=1 Tax=Streptomyces smyrnaeus TaxID=1387713 RepID=UPI0033ACD4A1